ncbi:MAG: hypothetical protein IRZ00_12110 [Gemmatimonadetes bacterium]|nr:hypothetical protein [Gemmatimonadota bacterium]
MRDRARKIKRRIGIVVGVAGLAALGNAVLVVTRGGLPSVPKDRPAMTADSARAPVPTAAPEAHG